MNPVPSALAFLLMIFDPADARDMAGWHHGGGFSLDAAVRIDGHPGSSPGRLRAGLERLLRYYARAPFALERLVQLAGDQLVYRFPRPQPDGRTELHLTPLELIERLAALIPPPRLHRHRYHGVLAPNSPQRPGSLPWHGRQPRPRWHRCQLLLVIGPCAPIFRCGTFPART